MAPESRRMQAAGVIFAWLQGEWLCSGISLPLNVHPRPLLVAQRQQSVHTVAFHPRQYTVSSITISLLKELHRFRGKMANEASIALTNRALRTIKTVRMLLF